MRSSLLITDVVLTDAPLASRAAGLLGHVACTVDVQLRLDGLALRMTRQGVYSITFPERRDSKGVRHPFMRPVDGPARREIERQIIGTLRREGRIP